MGDFRETRLWRTSLATQSESDPAAKAREWLRNAFEDFRDRASDLADQIARDLPDFTVHDITHLDALWEMADLIAGEEIKLTPTEAFVLGGAFLIHDLGMGLAAYPEGPAALREDPAWSDIVVSLLKQKLGRTPSADERRNPGESVELEATTELLRLRHAQRAEALASISWSSREGGETYHLIEKPELRSAFGPTIGQIAHSHWWTIDEIRQKFGDLPPLGAPASLGSANIPGEWRVDRLKIACLLRAADAAHLDSRRAPGFLRALRKPTGYADLHWDFQDRIHQPSIEGERLVFTSGDEFGVEKASAWWVGYELLQVCDRTLREVDTLLQDLATPYRFRARGVAGVEEPERLVKYVPTKGWWPIDAKVRVSNVASLVSKLGGEQLYGDDPTVPLRELIQNASDAVRARRLLERSKPGDWGDVTVRLGEDQHGRWIEVEDNGVGMSTAVLSGPLLDFGRSFWETPMAREQFPGLQAKAFASTGRYGIGFFSVFMWGKRVHVTTRRYDAAQSDTQVLQFEKGLALRPLLRSARSDELRSEGGTSVRVWLTRYAETTVERYRPAEDNRDRRVRQLPSEPSEMAALCRDLCPSLDVNLWIEFDGAHRELVIGASDWLTMDGERLLRRILAYTPQVYAPQLDADEFDSDRMAVSFGNQMRFLKGPGGDVVGRACIGIGFRQGPTPDFRPFLCGGLITVGGFYVDTVAFPAGMFVGEPTRATRDRAVPLVTGEELARWASEQADLLASTSYAPELLMHCAALVRTCGGDTANLPIAKGWNAIGTNGWLTKRDIAGWSDSPAELCLVSPRDIQDSLRKLRRELGSDYMEVHGSIWRHIGTDLFLDPSVLIVTQGPPGRGIVAQRPPGRRSILGRAYFSMDDVLSIEQALGQRGSEDVLAPFSNEAIWQYYALTLVGAVVEALASAWSCSVSDVIAASRSPGKEIRTELRELGTYSLLKPPRKPHPVSGYGRVLQRPSAAHG
jgi:hypothetical protein